MPGRNWPGWNWLDNLALPLASAMMLTAWVVPVVNAVLAIVLVHPTGLTLPAWLPLLLLLGGSRLGRFVAASRRWRWAAGVGGLLVAVATPAVSLPGATPQILYHQALDWSTGLPAVWLLFATGLGLWLRAVSIDWAEAATLRKGFLTGLIALALLAAAFPGSLAGWPLLFALSSLSGFALASFLDTRQESQRLTGMAQAPSRYWLTITAASVLILLVAAWATSLVLGPSHVRWLLQGLTWLLRLLVTLLYYPVLAIAYVVFAVFGPLVNWLHGLPADQVRPQTEAPDLAKQLQELPSKTQSIGVAGPWLQAGLILATLILAALISIALARRWYVRTADGVYEDRRLEWSWELMRGQLRQWLAARSRRRRRERFLPLDEDDRERIQVRLAYRHLLERAAEAGAPRQPGQTPEAYQVALSARWPAATEPLAVLTQAYVQARYSPGKLDSALVAEAVAAAGELQERLAQAPADDTSAATSAAAPEVA